MNFSNNHYGLNLNIVRVLHHIALFAMLHSSFVAPAQGILYAYIHKKEKKIYRGHYEQFSNHSKKEAEYVPTDIVQTKSQSNNGKSSVTVAKTNTAPVLRFDADLQVGIIGVSKEKPIDNPSDNLFTVTLGHSPATGHKAYLTYDLYGVNDHNGVSRRINDRLSIGGYLIKKQLSWTSQKEELDTAWLKQGENTILFTIPKEADYQYKIRNLKIEFENSTQLNQKLVLPDAQVILTKDGKIYVKGFVRGSSTGVKVQAGETFLEVNNNEFEGYVTLSEQDKKNHFIAVRALDPAGLLGQELVLLDNLIEADQLFATNKKEAVAQKLFAPESAFILEANGAFLSVSDTTLSRSYEMSITQLRDIDIAPLESGMVNVTKTGKGYRFLPDGAKFDKPVTIGIEYDAALLPSGYSVKDIKTFYFDTHYKRWKEIVKDSIDLKNNIVISKTTHFTDYINGIIQAPESPETSAFMPTMMNDIKAADPSSGLTIMSPPQVSQKGDASVSYPINLPAGIRGMQPQLTIQYSNDGGNGWMGEGWGLNVPSLSIDTRWGVPFFDAGNETEIYSLGGEQLIYKDGFMPHRHQGDGAPTTAVLARNIAGTRVFFPRKQGSFAKIERFGTTTATYYWKVTATDGTISWYGGNASALSTHVIKDNQNRIVHWGLYMVEDVFGNNIKYTYSSGTITTATSSAPGILGGKYFEPSSINYTGHGTDAGKYQVDFIKETTVTRTDLVIDGKLGIKRVSPYRLTGIIVKYLPDTQNPVIRSYAIGYGYGKFGKSRPLYITESGSDNLVSYRHDFEYYNDITQNGVDVYFGASIDHNVCIEPQPACQDTDGDGICDNVDACPNQAGTIANNGCPNVAAQCYIAAFSNYTTQPTNVFINGTSLPHNPYQFPQALNQFLADVNNVFNCNATATISTTANQVALYVYSTFPYTLSLSYATDPNGYTNQFQQFVSCNVSRPAEALTTNTVSTTPRYNYSTFYNHIKNNFSFGFTSNFTFGNPACPWLINLDFLLQGYMPSFISAPAALGSTKTESYSAGGYLGLGIGSNVITKQTTFGAQYTHGWDSSIGYVALIDITGDGLEDIILRDNGHLFYKKHTVTRTYDINGQELVTHNFEAKRNIYGINNFYRSKGESSSFNFQVSFGFHAVGGFAGVDTSKSRSESNVYFTDANGDGLTDIVQNEVVYFNRISNGDPVFEPDSWNTENLVITASTKNISIPDEYVAETVTYPKHDVVKVWEAPADGNIKITNNIALTDTTKESVVTIEMQPRSSQPVCYEVQFPVPFVQQTRYFYGVSSYPENYVDYPSNTCVPNLWGKLNSLKINNTVHQALPNLFYAHGDASGQYNRCPGSGTYDLPNCDMNGNWGSNVCFQIASPDFEQRADDWLNDILPSYPDIIEASSWDNSWLGWYEWNPFDSEIVLHNSVHSSLFLYTLTPNYTFTLTSTAGHPYSANTIYTDQESQPGASTVNVGLDVNISVNGTTLPNTYNLYNSFNTFANDLVAYYPGTQATNSNGIITIHTNSTNQFNSIIISPVSGSSQAYQFSEIECGSAGIPRTITENTGFANLKPSVKEIQYAFTKYRADGNELNEPVQEQAISLSIDLSGNEDASVAGKYIYTKISATHSKWQYENSNVVEDEKLIKKLVTFLPARIDELYNSAQNLIKIQEMKRREKAKDSAILKLQQIEKGTVHQVTSVNTNLLVSPCSEAGTLCLLFGTQLNAGNSSINNTITNYSTSCMPSQSSLYVKKGDKIYFRVHNVTNGNPKINWNPKVEYTDNALAAVSDSNAETPFNSQYSNAFILSKETPVIFPGNGTAQISWTNVSVSNPSDEIKYEIYKKVLTGAESGYPNIAETLIYQKICSPGIATTVSASSNQIAGYNMANLAITNTSSNPAGPTVTIFYFRVSSTSNVKWKQWEWRPKMTCITTQTVIGDGQVSQGTLTSTEVRYPIPNYSIYKSFACSDKYNLYNIASLGSGSSTINIKPSLTGVSFSGLSGKLNFVVKRDGVFRFRRVFTISGGSISGDFSTFSLGSAATGTGKIEIGYYVDDSGLVDGNESLLNRLATTGQPLAVITFTTTTVQTVNIYKQNINLFQKPNPKFGSMYRQWGQFAYNPAAVTGATQTAYGNLIKEEALVFSDANATQIQNAANQLEGQFQNVNLETGSASFMSNMQTFQNGNQQLYNIPFIPFIPYRNLSPSEGYQEKWHGLHVENYASALSYRAASMNQAFTGMNDGGDDDTVQDVLRTGAYALTRYSTGGGTNLSAGINVGFQEAGVTVGIQGSKSINGTSTQLTDYVDLNGDRYPDLISNTKVQYTTRTGGLYGSETMIGNYQGLMGEFSNSSRGIGASASFYKGGKPSGATNPASKRPKFNMFNGNNSTGISGNYSQGENSTKRMWSDINGDGMADLLLRDDATQMVSVRLNLGDNSVFPANTQTNWTAFRLFQGGSQGFGGGIGVNMFGGSIEAGASLNRTENHTDNTLQDMNGDGMADLISSQDTGLKVRINRGASFAAETTWSDYRLNKESQTVSVSLNAGATFAWIWPLLFVTLKIPDVNVNGSPYGTATNNTKKSISDFDGDGYPDLLEETSPGTIRVRPSRIRRTDLLKSVTNPLGGKFTVDYKVITPDYSNPNAKWVMTDVIIEDGYDFDNDGYDVYKKKFEYSNPKYDRREREFYGFETVKTIDYKMDDDGNPSAVYRTNVSKFHNNSYYLNGLLKESYVMKGSNEQQKFSRTVNTYRMHNVSQITGLMDLSTTVPLTFDTGGREGRKSAAAVLGYTTTYLYELGTTPLVTEIQYSYDQYGNVTQYRDSGSASAADNYRAVITYNTTTTLLNRNIVRVPQSIIVYKDPGTTILRKRETEADATTGVITKTKVTLKLSPLTIAETTMVYNSYGNLIQVSLPANFNGQVMFYKYTYDAGNKYIIKMEDAYPLSSESAYNPKIDKITKSKDISGNIVNYTYDGMGRLKTVQSPKELASNKPYTIAFKYYPTFADLPSQNCVTAASFIPMAITQHYDNQNPGNDIETITLMDGLSRPMQVKKDIETNTGTAQQPTYEERMSVSGVATYDEFGRVIQQYHPWHEAKNCTYNYQFNDYNTGFSTKTEYDEIDRPVKNIDPDGNISQQQFTIANDFYGNAALKSKSITDQNSQSQIITESYTDITGKTTSTKNILLADGVSTDIWTRFVYTPVGELISYTDAEGIMTSYEYDLGGRKVKIMHPDNGTTNFTFDNLGHVNTVQTANLAANTNLAPANRFITYKYQFNRVINILYPPTPDGANISNVTYKYGVAADGNNAGRVIYQQDATGKQSFKYGNMGEMVSNLRTVVGPNIPTRNFETNFDYDSWNRLKIIVYPDGEKVAYKYNKGGNLINIKGIVAGNGYDYIKRIDYDYYEQRTYLLYGNNTESFYNYTPSLRRLTNLNVKTSTQESLFANNYTYDKVGNVTSIGNNAVQNSVNAMGGHYNHSYTYDNLNRLSAAKGRFDGANSQLANGNDYTSEYDLNLKYRTNNGILRKNQKHNKNGQQLEANTYEHLYIAYGQSHKLATLIGPDDSALENFAYDPNGNLTKKEDVADSANNRDLYWDESNRLRVVSDEISMQHYIYDAGGERVLKAGSHMESLYENGTVVGNNVNFDTYTTYPSAFIVVGGDGEYSKHYYAGSQRIVSRIGEQSSEIFESHNRPAATQQSDTEPTFSEDEVRQLQIKDLSDILKKAKKGVPTFRKYTPDNDKGQDEGITGAAEAKSYIDNSTNAAPPTPSQFPYHNIYFYHPDHLGTSTYLTDANGQPYQFFLNLPFGETMAEQHSLTEDYETAYKFTGKELDSETGYYYYGARYYDPRTSVFLSVDPMAEKYPSFNPYAYCFQNPINVIDPTGMEGTDPPPPGGKWTFFDIVNLFTVAMDGENDSANDPAGRNCSMCCLNAFKANLTSLYGSSETKDVKIDGNMSSALQPLINKGYASNVTPLAATSNGKRITNKSSNVNQIDINLAETLNSLTPDGNIGIFAVGLAEEYHSTLVVVFKNVTLPILGPTTSYGFVEDSGGYRSFDAQGLNSKVSDFLLGAFEYYSGRKEVGGKRLPTGLKFDLDTKIYKLNKP